MYQTYNVIRLLFINKGQTCATENAMNYSCLLINDINRYFFTAIDIKEEPRGRWGVFVIVVETARHIWYRSQMVGSFRKKKLLGPLRAENFFIAEICISQFISTFAELSYTIGRIDFDCKTCFQELFISSSLGSIIYVYAGCSLHEFKIGMRMGCILHNGCLKSVKEKKLVTKSSLSFQVLASFINFLEFIFECIVKTKYLS